MIRLGKQYSKKNGPYHYAVYDVTAESLEELTLFFKNHGQCIDKTVLNEEEYDESKVTLREKTKEVVQIVQRKFNLILQGEKLQCDKKEYLDTFSLEAIKAIVYATDLAPKDIELDQYVGLVLAAYSQYNDTELFAARIMELLAIKSHLDIGLASQQITLIINLLRLPELLQESDKTNEEEEMPS